MHLYHENQSQKRQIVVFEIGFRVAKNMQTPYSDYSSTKIQKCVAQVVGRTLSSTTTNNNSRNSVKLRELIPRIFLIKGTPMTVMVEFPERLLLATQVERKLFQHQVMLYTLGHFYQQGKISAGYAAELLNCDKVNFFRLLSENGFAVIDYDKTDLEMEAQPLTHKA